MEKARSKHILIVEDNESLARMVKMSLESMGYTAHTETQGKSALTYVAERQPDLVILDINLPDCSGLQVARELRRLHHPWAIPILMLTINDKPVDQLKGFAHGADAYLTKPFNSTELLETVALLMGEAAISNGG